MAANIIKKMHVPAYLPGESGVQAEEKSGVDDDVKKTILILSMPIMVDDCDMSMGVDVELAMCMSDMVAVGSIDMVIPSIDMVAVLTDPQHWNDVM